MATEVSKQVEALCHLVQANGGRALVVGGWVRDSLLELKTGDYDLEVYGIAADDLLRILSEHHELDLVGVSFGVIKLKGQNIDISIPRQDSRLAAAPDAGSAETDKGVDTDASTDGGAARRINPHRAFAIAADPHMSVREAARRRDFTINTISYDPLTGKYEDPFDGREDLKKRLLRHTSDEYFADDPLRVLRAMQFVARFDLRVHPDTIALCRSISLQGLSPERIMAEWSKLLLQGTAISRGLDFLRDTQQLAFFPELLAMVDCPQDNQWHPEGDVWTHTGHCLDFFASHRIDDSYEDLVVGLAVLCHDLGKPATTRLEDGRWRAKRHASEGLPLTQTFLQRMTNSRSFLNDVLPLVKYHLVPRELFDIQASDTSLRRLARKVGRIDRLARVSLADAMGRPPLSRLEDELPAYEWLVQSAKELRVLDAEPVAILMGRHVMDLGVAAGPQIGEVIEACYEEQLEGRVQTLEEALEFARHYLASQ